MPKRTPHIVLFKDVDQDDIPLVGGKGANLGEMTKADFPVPEGFIVTAPAYDYFLQKTKLRHQIKDLMRGLNVHGPQELQRVSQAIRELINRTAIPDDLVREIIKAYLKLGVKTPVAVRSSATAEDLPDASFAGQQETYLNVAGEANLINKVRDAWSSLFTPRAIFYRQQKGFDHFKIGIAVPVQRMIQSDVSGVMFTVNPVNNDKSVVVIEAAWGLGELIVQGSITPDHYRVLKRTGEIVEKQIHRQTKMMISQKRDAQITNLVKPVPQKKQKAQKLSDELIVKLAKMGTKLQQHYYFPQDAEWAVEKGSIYLVQTRPVTTFESVKQQLTTDGRGATKGLELLVKGSPASPGLVSGIVRVIRSAAEIKKVKKGDVLVASMTTPDFVPAMKKVVAIVTDQGGQTSHAAIVSRELGVPCVVGTGKATSKLRSGTVVTVNGVTGEVFKGGIKVNQPIDKYSNIQIDKQKLPITELKTATKLYVNLAEPELAEKVAAENVDGVGLLRAEFMIAQLGIHPKKLIRERKSKSLVKALTAGILKIAEAFYPRPVVYRTTDFKTNEYRNLQGGKNFEPEEENPMIGFRGATRYLSDPQVFELELKAIRKVREKRNNLHLMIPFVRSVEQLKQIKRQVYAAGLRRSSSFQFWMMVELPVNVITLLEFIKVGVDGVSIGSNDLTMLILGVDRDNQEIIDEFNELNPAVLWALERTITLANQAGVSSSICGQAPSLYPELTEKLIGWGITSISVSADRIEATRRLIYQAERRQIK